jgi:hypothetical protein
MPTLNMNILAELKMHICDEHTKKQTKNWLKWVFQVHIDAEKAAAALAMQPVGTNIITTPSQLWLSTSLDPRVSHAFISLFVTWIFIQ